MSLRVMAHAVLFSLITFGSMAHAQRVTTPSVGRYLRSTTTKQLNSVHQFTEMLQSQGTKMPADVRCFFAGRCMKAAESISDGINLVNQLPWVENVSSELGFLALDFSDAMSAEPTTADQVKGLLELCRQIETKLRFALDNLPE